MILSERVKPISCLKSHTAETLRIVSDERQAMIITQHGETRAVLQNIDSSERTQGSFAMLKLLAQSSASKAEGKSTPVKQAFSDIRSRIKEAAK